MTKNSEQDITDSSIKANDRQKRQKEKPSLQTLLREILSPYANLLAWLNSFTISFLRREASASISSSLPMEALLALIDNLAPEKVTRNVRDNAGPFFNRGKNTTGILLVHGFSSTAQEMLGLANFLHEKEGYSTFCVLLAGHGTSPADLAQTNTIDWYRSVKEGYDFLQALCERIILVGHSMGGTLSLILAANENVEGIVSLCTPIKVEYFMQDYLYLVKDLLKYFPRKKEEIELMEKNNLLNYRVSALRAVDNMLDLMEIAKEELQKITAPIFAVTAGKDDRVPLDNAKKILQQVQSEIKEEFFAEKSIHTILFGEEKELIYNKTLEFIRFLESLS